MKTEEVVCLSVCPLSDSSHICKIKNKVQII